MNTAIEGCNSLTHSGQDLPTKLKITSISTRFNNLKHEGDKLLVIFVSKPVDITPRKSSKTRVKRSDSASASELAIKQTLADLQSTFASYKKVFEKRRVSYSAQPTSPKPSDGSGRSAVLSRTRSELKSPPPIGVEATTSPTHKPAAVAENHIDSRSRAYTDYKSDRRGDKVARNAVKDKVASFNKRAQEEEHIQMPNFGITFDARPRAKTADPVVGRPKGSPKLAQHKVDKAEPKLAPKTEQEKTEQPETKVEVDQVNQSEVASVPLRRKGRGLSKDERKQKIAAIRELFETSDLANILAEPGRQWKPLNLSRQSTAKGTPESSKRTSEDRASVSDSIKLELESATSLSESGNLASESVASSVDSAKLESKSTSEGAKPAVVEDIQHTPVEKSEAEAEEIKSRVVSDDHTKSTTGKDATTHEQVTPATVAVSPPPETRERLHTAPAVYKTVVKDLSSTKQQVITLNMDQPLTPTVAAPKVEPARAAERDISTTEVRVPKGGSLERNRGTSNFVRATRVTRSMSPQHRRHMEKKESHSQQFSPGRTRRPPLLQVSGKVSSLRDMFDSQAQTNTGFIPLHKRSNSDSKPYRVKVPTPSATAASSVHQRSSSMDTNLRASSHAVPSPVQEEPQTPPPPQQPRELSPDIVPIVKPQPVRPAQQSTHPQSPLMSSSIAESSSPHPPPRPHSPIGHVLENLNDSDIESESDGSIYESDTSSLDEGDLEWVGGEDEIDLPWGLDDPDTSLAEQRMFKSLR